MMMSSVDCGSGIRRLERLAMQSCVAVDRCRNILLRLELTPQLSVVGKVRLRMRMMIEVIAVGWFGERPTFGRQSLVCCLSLKIHVVWTP